ncbi:MAG: hypothetical protein V4510_02735 [bacterium]
MQQRFLLAAVAFLLVLPGAPTAAQGSAAPAPAPVAVLQDDSGDVAIGTPVQPISNPTPRLAQMDLVAATVQEQATEFLFTLTVASLEDGTEPPLGESAFYGLHFLQGDVQYAIQVGRIKSQQTGVFASLARYDPAEDRYYAVDYLPITQDRASASFVITVPRDLITDSHGAKPYVGTQISGFWADSQSFMEIFLFPVSFSGQAPPTIRDRMPNSGNGTTGVPVMLGPVQTGSARLSSQVPTRQSNGEAGTVVFTVTARNVGPRADHYRLEVSNPPLGWDVSLPNAVVDLDAGASVDVPVVVTMAFNHQHGSFKSFMLHAASATDAASHADLELGVRYPKVPQPAGHHNVLSLHSAPFSDDPTIPAYALAFGFNVEYAWMNALAKDDGDRGVAVPADPPSGFVPSVPNTFHWTVPLAPDLAIGLDFDLLRNGTFSGGFQSTTPMLGAVASGELAYYVDSTFDQFGTRTGGNRTVLARLATSPAQDMQASTPAYFSLKLTATPEGDRVVFRPKSSLVLELTVAGTRPDTAVARDPPKLLPGGLLDLPLFEYRDPVDATFAATAKLALQPIGSQDRVVNPGKTAVYQVAVRLAPDAGAHTIELHLSGKGVEWARLLDNPENRVAAGTWWNVTVAVAVPPGATTADSVDLVLRAQAQDDPALQALVRLYGTVSTSQNVPDEAALAASLEHTSQAQSPGLGFVAVLAAVGVATVGIRRRPREG